MIFGLTYLRQFNFASVVLRLFLALLFGGMLGLERTHRGRAAGFRTYMFVCTGAVLTLLLSQYEHLMLITLWNDIAQAIGIRTDVSRFGAQVINGIGFLAAGTILVTGRQEVKGLTTAAGLWASACMGLAIGAGFYECVITAFILMFLSIHVLPKFEAAIVAHAKNVNLYVEFTSLDDVGEIINRIKLLNAKINEVEITRRTEGDIWKPSAVFSVRLNQHNAHDQLFAAISEFDHVITIDEV